MIIAYRTAVIDHLRQALPVLREIGSHGGALSMDEARRRIANSPSVYVVALQMEHEETLSSGQIVGCLQMAAYVFTRFHGTVAAESQAWDLSAAIVGQLNGRALIPNTIVPEKLAIDSLWSGELDQSGAAILAVTWSTRILLGRDISGSSLAMTTSPLPPMTDLGTNEVATVVGPELPP